MTHSLNHLTSNKNIHWHVSAEQSHDDSLQPQEPWSETLIEQVGLFSHYLLNNKQAKESAEIVALGYWCRKANLHKIQKDFIEVSESQLRKPLGKVFHIAPANVDTVFFYSLVLSLLSGNENIVRISERSGEICRLLITLFNDFLKENNAPLIARNVSIIEYASVKEITTTTLSEWSDLRVVWGGDKAIDAISKISSDTPQLSFPDRYSVAVIKLCENDDLSNLATRFIADYLPFNQQACSSPKALFWLATPLELQNKFYQALLKQLVHHQQQFSVSEQVERQINLQKIVMLEQNAIRSKQLNAQLAQVELSTINAAILENHSGNGLLLTQNISELNQLPFHEKLQTVGYYGLSEEEINSIKNQTIKRLVSVGNALSFNHIWDGVNLTSALTTDDE